MNVWVPTVKDIEQITKQSHKLLTIEEGATAAEAAKKMSDNQVGCLLVFNEKGKFTGILSERDMLSKVLKGGDSSEKVLVRDIMTARPITCKMDTTISEVERLMDEHKIRHIPVVEYGLPVGMVSSRDIIAYQLRSNKAMKAAAEQLAMLSTGLKSLDFEDVIALAINEVPKSFQADRAVLYFTQKGALPALIYRKDCALADEDLLSLGPLKQTSQNAQTVCGKVCEQCEKLGGQTPRLMIPLTIFERDFKGGGKNTERPGLLCMCQFRPSTCEMEKLQLYKASLLQEVLNVNLTNAKLYQRYKKARHESETDVLTSVASRRLLEQLLETEYARAVRYEHHFSIAVIDLDDFKAINDRGGHAAGDRALQLLAQFMRRKVRSTDTLGRYGGDEFVLLMPETKLSDAAAMLDRLRREVGGILVPDVQTITISCGVAEWNGTTSDTVEMLIKRADRALYEAKSKGGNCVTADKSVESKV
jgi:diguanylate cyclase (GGDEF)-like protein